MTLKRRFCLWAGLATGVFLTLLFTGCETRSISGSGYKPQAPSGSKVGYRGELNEFDVGHPAGGAGLDEKDRRAFALTKIYAY